MQNVRAHRDSTSRYRGVWWETGKQRWRAAVCVDGRRKHVGWFTSELEAAEAVRAVRTESLPYAIDSLTR